MIPKHVLLVEDSPDDVKLTEHAFAKNHIGNKLVVATDGAQALEYLFGDPGSGRAPAELPALVLLDLKIAKVSGLKVLHKIRSTKRTMYLPVVVLTSSRDESDLITSYQNGCNSFIRKPIDFPDFIKCVKQLSLYWLLLNEMPKTD